MFATRMSGCRLGFNSKAERFHGTQLSNIKRKITEQAGLQVTVTGKPYAIAARAIPTGSALHHPERTSRKVHLANKTNL